MLNSTIKLIRLTIGYTTNAVAQETGYTLGYILKLENSKENISKKLMNSFQTVYDMPLSKIKEISRLEDYGYTRAGIISEISDYYIASGTNKSPKKYVSEDPEVLIKLIRIVTGQTLEDVADRMAVQMNYYETISDTLEHDMKMVELVDGDEDFGKLELYYAEQKLSALESYDLEITKKDHYNLAKAFDMTNCEMDKLMDMYDKELSRVELLSAISEYYIEKEMKVKTKVKGLK